MKSMKFNKNQTYPIPTAKFKRDGTNVRDKSDRFSRTRAEWKKFKLKQPMIYAHASSSEQVASVEDAARHRAYLASLRRKPRL